MDTQSITQFLVSPQADIRSYLVPPPGKTIEAVPITMTPQLANQIITDYAYEHQRKVRKNHMMFLAQQMTDGYWMPGTEFHLASFDNRFHIVDGQHTLHAVVESGKSIDLIMIIHYAASMDEIADIYSVLDRGLKRTHSDGFEAHELSEKVGLDKVKLSTFSAAVRAAYLGFNNTSSVSRKAYITAPQNLEKLIEVWSPYAVEYYAAIEGMPRTHGHVMKRVSVVASAIITFRYSPDKSEAFWRKVADDDMLGRYDPRKHLHDFLVNSISAGGSSQYYRKNPVTTVDVGKKCAYFWRAYFYGKEIQSLRFNNDAPVAFEGTPYDTSKPDNGFELE